MSIIPFIIFLSVGYISVSLETYRVFRKSGLLNDPEQAKRYWLYIYFWPAYTNPFKLLAQNLFKGYGEKGHIYPGWGGLQNFLNDLFKGKNRYAKHCQYCFNVELTESPDDTFLNSKYARIHLAIKGKTIILICNMSDSPQKKRQASRFELDRSVRIDHQQLIDELQSLNVSHDDIEKISSAIHQKDKSDASI